MEISSALIEEVVIKVLQQMNNTVVANKTLNTETSPGMKLTDVGAANKGTNPKEVVIGIAPAFGKTLHSTIKKIPHSVVLRELIAGIEEEGCVARVVRVLKTSDVGFITSYASKLSGSGIGIGVQSKGTIVISQKDLAPLTNLELFPLAPIITTDRYRAIGRNAAKYAKGDNPVPVPVVIDQTVLPIYQPMAVLLHNKETDEVVYNGEHHEMAVLFEK